MTSTDIANMALSRLGEPRISSIEENSPNAISCRTHYETVRDALLRAHAWNFATTRAQLSLTDTPAFGWDYAYPLPSDFIRLVTFNGRQAKMCAAEFILEGGLLLSDVEEARITYIRKITDPTLFDPSFTEALVFKLAGAIALDVTQSDSKRNEMEAMAERRLSMAAFHDASEFLVEVLSPITEGMARTRGIPTDFRNPLG